MRRKQVFRRGSIIELMDKSKVGKSDFFLKLKDDVFTLQLYSEYREMIIGVAREYGISEAASEDVVQRVILASIEKRDYLKNLSKKGLDAYMIVLIRREMRALIYKKRRSRKRREIESDVEDEEEIISAPMNASTYDALKQTLREMPGKQREILQYKYILGMYCAEIAESMGMSQSSVRKYLSRAKSKLIANAEKADRKRAKNKDLADEEPQKSI